MIDIKAILESPDRDDAIRKLIKPGPWTHNYMPVCEGPTVTCRKCGDLHYRNTSTTTSCPIPDPISLDWNLAMKLRDEAVEKNIDAWIETKKEIYKTVLSIKKRAASKESRLGVYANAFFANIAQPHHYILAAIVVKEQTNEQSD